MFELEEKLQELITWVMNTYGISRKEAIRSIECKINDV